MGLYAARVRFSGAPPSREEINGRLGVEGGDDCTLTGSQHEEHDILVFTSINAYAPAYATKVLRELGGVELDFDTLEPVSNQSPKFVEKPWLEHDEATRREVLRAFQQELDSYSTERT